MNDKPVPHATVQFIPMSDGLGANLIAKATTDSEGNFELNQMGGEPGCRVGKCKVTVTEGPMPDELRKMGQDGARKIKAFRASLANRPLPKSSQTIRTTSLEFDITGAEEDFEIKLKN